MQTPRLEAACSEYSRMGIYVSRRLKQKAYRDLANEVDVASGQVKAKGRFWEDSEENIQAAIADRDGADDDLDTAVQEARLKLAARGKDATSTLPYTAIFHKNASYYTAAPLDEEVKRYSELAERLKAHLPEEDEVRVNYLPHIEVGVVQYQAATEALDKARTAQALALTEYETAKDAWRVLIEKIYGVLVADLGRKKAERYFPKSKRSSGSTKKVSAKAPAPAEIKW